MFQFLTLYYKIYDVILRKSKYKNASRRKEKLPPFLPTLHPRDYPLLCMSHTSSALFQRLKLFLDKQEEWQRTLHCKLLGDLCALKYFYRVSSQKRNFLVKGWAREILQHALLTGPTNTWINQDRLSARVFNLFPLSHPDKRHFNYRHVPHFFVLSFLWASNVLHWLVHLVITKNSSLCMKDTRLLSDVQRMFPSSWRASSYHTEF